MRVVLQRVSSANVTIGGRVAGQIGRGLLILQGIEAADTAADGEWLAQKITRLRIFPDEAAQMNRSVADIGGEILLISQFTLHASTAKGSRPSFNAAARPEHARPLYEQFIVQLGNALGRPVQTGEFGKMMQVTLVNDGPVTLIIDSKIRD
ncbi:MAG: D-aminoacyl-tRNA deacylase [Verrucomicrobiota bacterium]|nr:D-aminoacyl-tRNA deacylase [Verrucomicrobiota bacterium]